MRVGVVGVGIVGNAVAKGMEFLKHQVKVHDIKMTTTIDDVFETDICYLCVPTPSDDNWRCDTSVVEDTIRLLWNRKYPGIIAIKSTVEPGTTRRLQEKFQTHRICFVPEFLRERFSVPDFIEDHDICVIGTESDEVYETVKRSHGDLPKQFFRMPPTEAELVKYMNNIHNATLVVLANSFYEISKHLGADYSKIKNALVCRNHIHDMYLDCSEFTRGFGGMCLPKDLRALCALVGRNEIDIDFFDNILKENAKYKITCYEGMRKE